MRKKSIVCLAALVAALGVVVGWGYFGQESRPVGDPDPFGVRMAMLRPVLTVAPAHAKGLWHIENDGTWDSCDGISGTYGWDDITIDMSWAYTGHPKQVFAYVDSAMRGLEWQLDASSETDERVWSKPIGPHVTATATLVGGPGVDSPDWSFEASAPPAVHPGRGC